MQMQWTGSQQRVRRGQTLVEFALTLPIVLLLLFGIIEFARIFQAWVSLQNSARVAVRAAITGDWDPEVVYDWMVNNPPPDAQTDKDTLLEHWVPCDESGAIFLNQWGFLCDPTEDEHQGLRNDIARMPWIVENARIGASGLAIGNGDAIVGLNNDANLPIDTYGEFNESENEPGWFHVFMCSSRPSVITGSEDTRYVTDNDRLCEVQESTHDASASFGPSVGEEQYDAGGPGDVIEVVVHFNHPLITPIMPMLGGNGEYVLLKARRVGVNESFRNTRAVNLPPQIELPTAPPVTNTPFSNATATESPIPTDFLSPTPITPTATASPTATPDCSNLTVSSVSVLANYLQIGVQNANDAPMYISKAEVYWRNPGIFTAN